MQVVPQARHKISCHHGLARKRSLLMSTSFRHYPSLLSSVTNTEASILRSKVHKLLLLITSSCYYFVRYTDRHVMIVALFYILVFLIVFGGGMALKSITTCMQILNPITHPLFPTNSTMR